jgi:hypothetical protein
MKKVKHLISIIVVATALVSCTDEEGTSSFVPNVQITYPHDNDIVSGTITITADATDPRGVAMVFFYLYIYDYPDLGDDDSSEPFQYVFNTTSYPNGTEVRINAIALAYGEYLSSNNDEISVTIQN